MANSGTSARKTRKWIDITLPMRDAMVSWPGDPPAIITKPRDMEKGDSYNISLLNITSHIGTHMDAPRHFIRKGATIDTFPLDIAVGTCLIIEIKDPESIKIEDIRKYRIRKGERVLFKTVNSSRAYKTDAFVEDYVYITPEAANYLVEKGVSLVGIDYLSVGSIKKHETMVQVHKALLGNNIWILEGVNLAGVKPGRYEFICLPLRLEKGDGGCARVVIRSL